MNHIKHSVFEYNGSKPLSDAEREEIRKRYQELLDRAIEITAHPSGWVSMIRFATPEDAEEAAELEERMFITLKGEAAVRHFQANYDD